MTSVWLFSPWKQHNIPQMLCYVVSITKTNGCNSSLGGEGESSRGLCYRTENLAAVEILYDLLLTNFWGVM